LFREHTGKVRERASLFKEHEGKIRERAAVFNEDEGMFMELEETGREVFREHEDVVWGMFRRRSGIMSAETRDTIPLRVCEYLVVYLTLILLVLDSIIDILCLYVYLV
jgi:hypothetical protein